VSIQLPDPRNENILIHVGGELLPRDLPAEQAGKTHHGGVDPRLPLPFTSPTATMNLPHRTIGRETDGSPRQTYARIDVR